MLSFNKQKKTIGEAKTQEASAPLETLQSPLITEEFATQFEASGVIGPVRAKKDTFISSGALFTGVIEGEGNIIVEGKVEGNISCTHMVRIENSGHVKGEIRAQQIVINGAVEGRCYADSLSIQPKGSMRGDIFADEIAIEKGGVFIGQSQLMQKAPSTTTQGKITPLKAAVSSSSEKEKKEEALSQKAN